MMKNNKLISLLLILCLITALLVSCGEESDSKENSNSSQETSTIDYASSVKLDLNSSETMKIKAEVKLFVDGDTTHFYVDKSIVESGVLKARYLSINTPESTGKIEEYGKAASNYTKETLSKATSIYLESDDNKLNADSTGDRYLVWVWYKTSDSEEYRNLNIEILQRGLAIASSSANPCNFLSSSIIPSFNVSETNSGNITIYANYEYATFNISYDLQGGTWGNSIEITGSATSTVTSTSNNDFWNGYASNVYLFSGSSYGSGLNATWSERIGITFDDTIGAYAVTSVAKSGSTDFVYADCDYILQLSSSHSNYNSLKGNFTKVEVGFIVKFVGDPTTGSCNVEFYSKDSVSGGTIENYVTEYTIATIPQILPTPKYEGKTFKGWALSANGAPMSSLPIDTIGNITLYANWE